MTAAGRSFMQNRDRGLAAGAAQMEEPVRFGLLGPLVIWAPQRSRPVSVVGRESRLLAALLMRPSQPVWSERLMEAIWGDELPASPVAALHNVVYRLRRLFGDVGLQDSIVGRSAGYAVLASPEVVDAGRFETLLRSASVLDGHSARTALRGALSLWRGSAFEGLSGHSSAFAGEAQRLEALWFVALEGRIEADLELGRPNEVIGELTAFTAQWPLKENFWALLIVALDRAGLQAEALRAYRRARESLASEMGIEPTLSLQRLEEDILDRQPGQVVRGLWVDK